MTIISKNEIGPKGKYSTEWSQRKEKYSIEWLRERGFSDCPIASIDNKTALYDLKLVEAVARKVDTRIVLSKDANFRPRCFVVKLYFVILYHIKRFLNTVRKSTPTQPKSM